MSTVLLLSGDLMFAGPIRAAATDEGYAFQLAGSLGEKQKSLDLAVILVDLAFVKMTPAEIAQWAASCDSPPRLVGFGPHVDESGLKEAIEAGFDAVVTRGQMHRGARAILQKVAPLNK